MSEPIRLAHPDTRLYSGLPGSGTTTCAIEALAECLTSGDSRAIVLVPTRRARGEIIRRCLEIDKEILGKAVIVCTATIESLLTEDPTKKSIRLDDPQTVWRRLVESAMGDLKTFAEELNQDIVHLLPEVRLPEKQCSGQTAGAADEARATPLEKTSHALAEFDAVFVEDIESLPTPLLQLVELIARSGACVVASYHPDQVIPRPKSDFPAAPLESVPTLASRIVELPTTSIPQASAALIRSFVGAEIAYDTDGSGRLAFAEPLSLTDDSVIFYRFESESDARFMLTETLATTHPVPRAPGAGQYEETEPPLLPAFCESGDLVGIFTVGFIDSDRNALLKAARQSGTDMVSYKITNLRDDPRHELYLRFLNGGHLPGRSRKRETAAESILEVTSLFFENLLRPLPVEAVEGGLHEFRKRLCEEPLLSTTDHPVPPAVIARASELALGVPAVSTRLVELLGSWEGFERHQSLTEIRVRWLGRKVEKQLPGHRKGGQRVRAGLVAQRLLTGDCPSDARKAAWDLWKGGTDRPTIPLELPANEIAVFPGASSHGVRCDVAIVWGAGDDLLFGYSGVTVESTERAKGKLALMVGRADKRVVLVTWGPSQLETLLAGSVQRWSTPGLDA